MIRSSILRKSSSGDKVVQPLEINRGQLVDDDRRLQHPFLVDEFHDTGVIPVSYTHLDVYKRQDTGSCCHCSATSSEDELAL